MKTSGERIVRKTLSGYLFLTVTGLALMAGAVKATEPAVPVAAAPGPATSGKDIWKGTCQVCHAAGLLGAPKIGDKAAWAPRIAKGMEVLKDHALHGFSEMPPKGGNDALSDEDVVKALEYMVGQSK
jgi:cytochrome c5